MVFFITLENLSQFLLSDSDSIEMTFKAAHKGAAIERCTVQNVYNSVCETLTQISKEKEMLIKAQTKRNLNVIRCEGIIIL